MDNSTPIIPFVSVVMPLYNKQKEVGRAIQSALSQTFTDFELVVVNDGSTDGGPDVVRAFENQRIRIIDQPNQGVSATRNRGIAEAKADLIAFLDADDEWKPDFLETILRLRNKYPTCSVYATNYLFALPDGSCRPTIIRGILKQCNEEQLIDYFTVAANSDPPLCSSAVAVTKEAITSIGGFPVGITSGEDLLTWARLASRYEIAYSTQTCALHYNPVFVSERRGRDPQHPDLVGKGLTDLVTTGDPLKTRGLNEYRALWNRMRAVTFMHLGERLNAVRELRKALQYSFGLKAALLLLMALLPYDVGSRIMTLRKSMKQRVPKKHFSER